MNGKQFHLAAILSVSTGFLFPAPGTDAPIDCVYDILNFMTGDDLYTHALVRAADECRPLLSEQLPFLREIDLQPRRAEMKTNWQGILDELVVRYGAYHTVYPLGADDHEIIDPIEELKRMRPDAEVHIITTPDDDISPMDDINWK